MFSYLLQFEVEASNLNTLTYIFYYQLLQPVAYLLHHYPLNKNIYLKTNYLVCYIYRHKVSLKESFEMQ